MSKKLDIDFSVGSVDEFFSSPRHKIVTASLKQKVRVASINNIPGFVHIANDTLIRLSQQDFWRIGQDEQGFFIERLVDDDSGPVKG